MSRPHVGAYLSIRRLQVGDRSSSLAECQPAKSGRFTHKPGGPHECTWLPGDGIEVCSKCGVTRGEKPLPYRPANQPLIPEKSVLQGLGLTPDAVKQMLPRRTDPGKPVPINLKYATIKPTQEQLQAIFTTITTDPKLQPDIAKVEEGGSADIRTTCPRCRNVLRLEISRGVLAGQCVIRGCLDWWNPI